MRIGNRAAVVLVSWLALACTGPGDERAASGLHRVRAAPAAAAALRARGAALLEDYGAFQLLDAPAEAIAEVGEEAGVEVRDQDLRIHLNSGELDTGAPATAALAASPAGDPSTPALQLVQFVGPIRPEWRTDLERSGLQVVSYVPANAYLVYGPPARLAAFQRGAAAARAVQFQAPYAPAQKLHAAIAGAAAVPGAYAVQLVEDPAANADTLALASSLARGAPRVQRALGYVNVVLQADASAAAALAARPDVVSVQAWSAPRLQDERQDMILAGPLTSGGAPAGPGYLDWLAAKGFTQAQFDVSAFGVDVTDSGVDDGTDQPAHFGLYRGGDLSAGSRVVYNRLEGTPHAGSTLQGCDGHGTLNAHVIGGSAGSAAAPFADAQGFRYGLGVAPFVRLGSSVIFDPDFFTDPSYEDLQSRAHAAGMRVSSNSWGADTSTYDADCQRYDALVRDARPVASAMPAEGNQEMVIVFSAGNQGPTGGSIGSPGNAKNVISVGAAEGVQAFGGADGCGTGDGEADSALDVASFSSRGPAADGRLRPDLLAPGTHISGGVAQDAGQRADPPRYPLGRALGCFDANGVCGGHALAFAPPGQQWYTASSGTSHSAPAVAGAAALVRQWFLNQALPAPSPAMTKAFLVNAARYMSGAGAGDALFSNSQGMGLVDLGAAFDATPRLLRDQEAADLFTATGQARTFTGNAGDPSRPLRVTLAWTDAPGPTFGAAYANDLDLTVEVGGQVYRGNVFSGATSATGGAADPRNNLESVFLPAGTVGPFTVTVTAANVVADGVPGNASALDQDFALVVVNACAEVTPAAPTGLAVTPAGDNVLAVAWSPVADVTGYAVYRAPAAGGPWERVAEVGAPPLLDGGRSGGLTFHYQVRARRACALSAPSAPAAGTATGRCVQPPGFAGLGSAATTGAVTCGSALAWAAATPSCGGAVTYDVHRGPPGFHPAASNRIATGVAATAWTDSGALAPGVEYAYVVRAVETVPGQDPVADENVLARTVRPEFTGSDFLDDFDGQRPASPDAWWEERVVSGADALGLVRGCHYQSMSTAYRLGAAGSDCGGAYASSTESRLVLGGGVAGGFFIPAPGATLGFRLWHDLEAGFDGAWLEYSTTGPHGTFHVVPTGATAERPYIAEGGYASTSHGAPAWSGTMAPSSGRLSQVTVNLDALAGRTVWFAWRFRSDDLVEGEGVYLDDVRVAGTGGACATTAPPIGSAVRYRVSLPGSTAADAPVTVSVEALDGAGHVAADHAGSAALATDDPLAVLPAGLTFRNGLASAQLRLRAAGRRLVTVRDAAFPALRATGATVVTPGAASALRFETQPPPARAGQALAPAPAVAVVDAFGNRATSAASVTFSLAAGPAGGTLAGTLAVPAGSGLATGSDLWLDRAGEGYRLAASAPGLAQVVSDPFAVAAGAARGLAVAAQPSAVTAGQPFAPALAVQPVDAFGNPVATAADVSLAVASGPPGAQVRGASWASTAGAAARFDAAWLDRAGRYTLVASAPSLGSATTAEIAVAAAAPARVRFVRPPPAGEAGMPLAPAPAVALEDAFGNACDAASSPSLSVHLVSGSGPGMLLGDTSAVPLDGVATFPRLALDRPGRFTVFVGGGGLGGATSAPFDVAPGPVARFVLSGPARADVGEEVTLQAVAADAAGAAQSGYLGTATLTSTDAAAEVPAGAIAFPGGHSGALRLVFRTGGAQVVSLRENGGAGAAGSFTVEVSGGGSSGSSGGGCQTGEAGAGGAILLALLAALRRGARGRGRGARGVRPASLAALAAVLAFAAACGGGGGTPCAGDTVECGGACVRTATDPRHCGACGAACAEGLVCSAGACAVACAAPLATCGSGPDATCADTRSDPAHCGGCGVACAPGQVCSAGRCAVTCQAPLATCGAGEAAFCADTYGDPGHCGGCDVACPQGQVCDAGHCALTCEGTGATLCGGRCFDLERDDAHCGSCTIACEAGSACRDGACVPTCPAGQERCGDRCVDLATDAASCGACGRACPAGAACAAGACAPLVCPDGFGLPGQPDLVGHRSFSVDAADLDGDGLPDLLASNVPIDPWVDASSVQVLRNLGGRRFAAPVVYALEFEPLTVRLADLDGDGIADGLVVGRVDHEVWSEPKLAYLRGRGDGSFDPPVTIHEAGPGPLNGRGAAVADLDGDGFPDLVATGGSVTVVRGGAGGPRPPATHALPWPWSSAVAVDTGDLDGNGVPDVVLGSSIRVGAYLNPGGGGPAGAPASWVDLPGEAQGVAVADVDGDGHQDVLAAVQYGIDSTGLVVSRGDGTGALGAPALYLVAGAPYALAVGDVDGDGRPDAALGNWGDDLRQVDLLRNAGDGTFLPSEPYFEAGASELAWTDLDADGRLDLAAASGPGMGLHLLWNAGGGRLEQPGLQPLAPGAQGHVYSVALADLDGDGAVDAAAGDAENGKLYLLRGAAGGVFTPSAVLDAPRVLSVLPGDLDGDGAVDLVVVQSSAAQPLLSRSGSYQAARSVGLLEGLDGVALVDVDGDGRLDLVGNPRWGAPTRWWPGLSDGAFADSAAIDARTGLVLAGDVDGNGWADVVRVDSSSGGVHVAPGLGGGAFGPTVTSPVVTSGLMGAALADLDGDGLLDVAVADRHDRRVGVLLGRGDGSFEPPQWQPFIASDRIAAGALPGLGRSVVLVASEISEAVGVFEVDANRVLQRPRRWTTRAGVSYWPGGVAAGDVDGDLRPDVVVGAAGGVVVLPSRCLP